LVPDHLEYYQVPRSTPRNARICYRFIENKPYSYRFLMCKRQRTSNKVRLQILSSGMLQK